MLALRTGIGTSAPSKGPANGAPAGKGRRVHDSAVTRIVMRALLASLAFGFGFAVGAPSATVAAQADGVVLFASDATGNGDIYAIPAVGGGRARITSSALREETPAWAPDGETIVFARGTLRYSNLFARRSGGVLQRLTENRYCNDRKPTFSTDGTELAYERGVIRFREIWKLGLRRPTQTLSIRAAPSAIAPDLNRNRLLFVGRVFVVDGRRQGEIYVASTAGVRRLSPTRASDFSPAWSPDGRRIAFAREVAGNRDIYVMAADGSAVQRLTEDPGTDDEPTWSPDGDRIAFASDRDGDFDLYTVELGTRHVAQLTNTPGADRQPDWRPTPARTRIPLSRRISRSPDICRIEQRRAVRLLGAHDRVLRGLVVLRDRVFACRMRVPVVLERRDGRIWKSLGRTLTDDAGAFGLRVRTGRGTYRVRAPRIARNLPTPDFFRICLAAHSPTVVRRT